MKIKFWTRKYVYTYDNDNMFVFPQQGWIQICFKEDNVWITTEVKH